MNDYGSTDPNHTTALSDLHEARKEALYAVSEMRQFGTTSHPPFLSPADGDDKTLATVCTQKVVDYPLQLQPYRDNSQNWDVDLGGIEIPKKINTGKRKRRSGGQKADLWLCRQPKIPMRDMSDVISVANTTVQYSSNRPDRSDSPLTGKNTYHLRTGTEYGELVFTDRRAFEAVASGQMTYQQAFDTGAAIQKGEVESTGSEGYTPAIPSNTNSAGLNRGSSHKTRSFNIVFPADILLQLVELADEVAAEIDTLIEIDNPDYESDGRGAV